MMGGSVVVVSTKNSVPKLTCGETYPVVVRSGKEFIVDFYGGYLWLKDARVAGVFLERIKHG